MSNQDRIFTPDGRRHYRRQYSRGEVWAGALVLAGLCGVAAWVVYRGAHPEPDRLADSSVLSPAQDETAARGPLPPQLAAKGWHEGPVSQFDADNLYLKINGRDGYYKSFGFERLYCVSLMHDDEPTNAVDIELYDLDRAANALGAYSGERSGDVKAEVSDSGVTHLSRNALFMTRGRYYVRAIGSDETAEVRAQLLYLKAALETGIQGQPLPWAYGFFAEHLGVDPTKVSYLKQNAFSFDFAQKVYVAPLATEAPPDDEDDRQTTEAKDGGPQPAKKTAARHGSEDAEEAAGSAVDRTSQEAEVFLVEAADATAASQLAAQFTQGFSSYGNEFEDEAGNTWVRDRYLGTLARATPIGRWVLGVRNATDSQAAAAALSKLQTALQASAISQDGE